MQDDPEASFDEFLEAIFTYLQQLLRHDLKQVRVYLEKDVQPEIEGVFSELQSRLARTLEPWQYGDLKDALTEAFTQVQYAFVRVVNWLNLEELLGAQQTFSLAQVLDIAVKSAMQPLKGFTPNLHITTEGEQPMGVDVLRILSDILFIALDNVAQHAKVLGSPQIDVSATFYPYRARLGVTVKSQVAAGVRNANVDRTLEGIRNLIQLDTYRDKVRSEGGSGLVKLKRIVSAYRIHDLDFGFENDESFFVEVGIPISLRPAVSDDDVLVKAPG